MDTLDDLGAQLHALTSGQPAQPGDRVPGVTRRARRIRRTRAAVSAAAAVAVLAPAGLLLTSARHDATPQFAHSDVLTWPDRSVASDRGLGDGALAALESDANAAVLDVHWLYRAKVELPDHNPAYVAVLTAEVQGQDLLVVATSFGHVLDAHGMATDAEPGAAPPWDTHDRTVLEPGKPLDHVGLYLSYADSASLHSAMALVLSDPRARTLTWTQQPLPFAPPTRGSEPAPATSKDGVFVTSLGALTGPVSVTVSDARGHRAAYPLASGRAHVELVQPAAPEYPAGQQFLAGGAGQSEQAADGSWTMTQYSDGAGWPQPKRAVYVRCYGGGSVQVVLEGDKGQTLASGRVPCDDVSRRAVGPVRTTGNVTDLVITPDRLQGISFALVALD